MQPKRSSITNSTRHSSSSYTPSRWDTLQESSPILHHPSLQPPIIMTTTPPPVPSSIPGIVINPVPVPNIMTTVPKSYMLNGVLVTMNVFKSTRVVTNSVLYPKAIRLLAFNDKQWIELITMIKAKQQKLFHAVTISINDPEKLMNTHSISKLLGECKRNLSQYDLIDVFTIVLQEPCSVVPSHAQFSLLQDNANPLQPIPLCSTTFSLITCNSLCNKLLTPPNDIQVR